MVKLKQVEQDFALQMEALGFKQVDDLLNMDAADRANARAREIAHMPDDLSPHKPRGDRRRDLRPSGHPALPGRRVRHGEHIPQPRAGTAGLDRNLTAREAGAG